MKLHTAELHLLELPFRLPVSHATKKRDSCDSVLVRVEAEDGTVGWGEGAPRPYVGGEDGDSVFRELEEVLWPAVAARDLPEYDGDMRGFLRAVDGMLPDSEARGDLVAHHAARCAIELAIIDCQLRRASTSLGAALGECRPELTYNGMLPTGDAQLGAMVLKMMARLGVTQVKVKVGEGDDLARIAMLRTILGDDATVIADANGAWTLTDALQKIPSLGEAGVALIEQPLPRGSIEDLAELRRAIDVPIMVDESLVTLADARALIAAGACDVLNIRLSKCGGLGRSLEFIDLARAAGLQWQLGCHVGETAILSAAGRALGLSVDDAIFCEGSIGEWLLEEDLTSPSVQLGSGGQAGPIEGDGLGIEILPDRVDRYSVRHKTLGTSA